MEQEMDCSRKKRRTTRGLVTKLLTKVKESLEEETEAVDQRKLRQFEIDLKEKAECLKELDETVLNNLFDTDADEETCGNEAEEANAIQEKITYQLICIQDALKEIDDGVKSIRSVSLQQSMSRESIGSAESKVETTSNIAVASSSEMVLAGRSVRVKLPKLEMRKFSGKVQDWQEFWDSFKSAVHCDSGLAKIDKFKYLRSYLEEPARRVIAELPLTDADYDSAVEILVKRYAKTTVIKRVHINDMLNLAPVFNERNVSRLRHFLDDIETHFRGLEALGVDKDSYSSIVVPVLMDKLPEPIRINMIRFGTEYLDWTLDEMLETLAKEVEVRECHVSMFRPNQSSANQQQVRPRQQQQQNEKMEPQVPCSHSNARSVHFAMKNIMPKF